MTEEVKADIPPAKDPLKPVDTEKCIADLFKNDVLSDMTLKNPNSNVT